MTVTATVRVTVRVGDSEGDRGWATAGVTARCECNYLTTLVNASNAARKC